MYTKEHPVPYYGSFKAPDFTKVTALLAGAVVGYTIYTVVRDLLTTFTTSAAL